MRGQRETGLTIVVDVPREEGWAGTAGLEAPMGALNWTWELEGHKT
jgi:hypothetical protein